MREKSHSSETWTFSRRIFTFFSEIPVWWTWGKHSQYPGFQKACQKQKPGSASLTAGERRLPHRAGGGSRQAVPGQPREQRLCGGDQGHDHSGGSEGTGDQGEP